MINEFASKLIAKLSKAVSKNLGDTILLSGGLDSSILAFLARHDVKAITVTFERYGSDNEYASKVAKLLDLEHYHKVLNVNEALELIPQVIKILKTFDPALPNDITIYAGLKLAKQLKLKSVITGDGCDELFAGYSYMQSLDNLNEYIAKIAKSMRFSSNELGASLGLKILQPYLDKNFVKFALSIPSGLKLKKNDGKTYGKWILRKAFENKLPSEIIWREKSAIEYGSGSTKLREIIKNKVSDDYFNAKQKIYPIKLMSKEHLYYYEIYRNVVGDVPRVKAGERRCKACGAGVKSKALHCRICGAYPI
ncbi:MAG: asparagine synthase-related protein [Candidatus Thermoplasmatota archaeon]